MAPDQHQYDRGAAEHPAAPAGACAGRPNIVLILADDLGYSDIGCYGSEIRTPVLDRLGRAGVRLTHFYNAARCAPTRASLLTGLHPHQTGIGDLNRDDRPWGYPGTLNDHCPTLAEVLRDAGYATCLSGKWHLSANVEQPDASWPTRRGFDDFYGIIGGTASYYQPRRLYRNETPVDDEVLSDGYVFTDAISEHVAKFIREQSRTGRPFFSYVSFTAPHFPLHAPDDDIRSYDGVYDAGWDRLRRDRLDRLVSEGALPAGTTLSERDPARPAWNETPHKAWNARRMQVYAAQVDRMDRGVGRIVETLEAENQLDNTLLIFLSDNGGCAEHIPARAVLGDDAAPSVTRDGRRVRFGNDSSVLPGPEDTYSSYGPSWANLSNTPFRLYKRWVHEGGIATPLIVHWPDGNLADRTIVDHPYQVTDIMPTLLDACGAEYPADRADDATFPPLPGRSMLGSWRGHPVAQEEPLFWEHLGNCAIRHGPWKLVREAHRPWELYDLGTDRTEQWDVADKYPELVTTLAESWHAWAHRVGVIPYQLIERHYHQRHRYLPRDRALDL